MDEWGAGRGSKIHTLHFCCKDQTWEGGGRGLALASLVNIIIYCTLVGKNAIWEEDHLKLKSRIKSGLA
jgi:hypothetical protein